MNEQWLGRRRGPRVPGGGFCTEYTDGSTCFAMISDVSPSGLRLHRPARAASGATGGRIALEFDLPGIDDVIWASAEVAFDQVWRPGDAPADQPLLRTTGVRIVAAADRHLRLIREYAHSRSLGIDTYAERRRFASRPNLPPPEPLAPWECAGWR